MKEPQTITLCFGNKVKLCVLTRKDVPKICYVGNSRVVHIFIKLAGYI